MRNTKRGICLLLCACLLLPSIGGFSALAAPSPVFYYEELGDNEISVAGYEGDLPQKLVIPQKIDGKTVKEISWNAFSDCGEITQLVIPEGVTAILDSAFGRCVSLETVTLPSTLVSLGGNAFSDCVSLKKIVLPESLSYIGYYAFYGCTSLKTAVLPQGLKEIDYYTFGGCLSLQAIELPPTLEYLGTGAFSSCESLTSVTLPPTLKTVNEEAFGWCTALKTVSIPKGVVDIGPCAFSSCEALSALELPSTLEVIDTEAFSCCAALKTVHIPASVTYVDPEAFRNCGSLTALTADGNNACYTAMNGVLYSKDLSELVVYPTGKEDTSFRLPDPVRTVSGRSAFSDTALTKLDLNLAEQVAPGALATSGISVLTKAADNNALTIRDNVLYNETGSELLDYPGGLTAASFTVPQNVRTIGDSAFLGNDCLKKVVLPEGLEEILYQAFAESNVEEAALPASVRLLDTAVFRNCEKLKKINIPDGVTEIPWEAFSGCASLRSVTIPSGVKRIEDYAFAWCENLKTATFSNGLERIGCAAFFGCAALTNIKIPDSVCYIASEAFDETGWMNTRPDGPVYLGKVLYACRGELPEGSSYTVKPGTVMISPYAFAWQWGLASLSVPDSVRYVGSEAVTGTEWFEANLPDGPIYMGKAFYGYKGNFSGSSFSLKEGTVSATPDAFWPLETTQTLTLPASLEEMEATDLLSLPHLKSITVAKGNKAFASEGGVLYNKDKTELLIYPPEKADKSFEVPYGVERLGVWAFSGNAHLQKLTVHTDLKDVWAGRDDCPALKHIYYSGVRRLWDEIEGADDLLGDSTLHFTHEEVFKETDRTIVVIPDCLVGDVTRTLNEEKGLPVKRPDGGAPQEYDLAGTGMTVTTAGDKQKTVILMGDNDGDGQITSADARSALRYSVGLDGPTPAQLAASKVTGQESVTSADARLILRASVSLEDAREWYKAA